MAKDKQHVHDRDLKDLGNFTVICDLDDTITQTTQHLRIAGKVEFVPGALALIKDMHTRGAKIAIISHSVFKTAYAYSALYELQKIGVNDIPYVCLYDVVLSELEHAEITHSPSREKQLIKFPDVSDNFEIDIGSVSLVQVAEKLAANHQRRLIELFGKGVSSKMGGIALKMLGISIEMCQEMNICTIGDAITDVVQARILQDDFNFLRAYGFWLQAGNRDEHLFEHYAIELCSNITREYNIPTKCMVEHLMNGVALVRGMQLPEKFDPQKWHELSKLSVESWRFILSEVQVKHQQEVVRQEILASRKEEKFRRNAGLKSHRRDDDDLSAIGARLSLQKEPDLLDKIEDDDLFSRGCGMLARCATYSDFEEIDGTKLDRNKVCPAVQNSPLVEGQCKQKALEVQSCQSPGLSGGSMPSSASRSEDKAAEEIRSFVHRVVEERIAAERHDKLAAGL